MSAAQDKIRLQLRHISKRFPGVLANNDISLSVYPGEIHALLGENGAGKTTLMNIVYGLLHADSGEIFLHDQPIDIRTPREAIQKGIGMVHQHFMLVPTLTVAENIILGLRPFTKHLLDIKAIGQDITKVASKYGMRINPMELVSRLSVGVQQRVEIVKALYRGVDLLILDEPTSVLTPQETSELFDTLKNLTGNGLSIIFITHKLNEVMNVADRVSVLRDGKLIATKPASETDVNELAFMMVDREISLSFDKGGPGGDQPVLVVEDLTVSEKARNLIDHVSLKVCGREILGVAGVDGNGQNELALAITGLLRPTSGKILLDGLDITHKSVRRRNEAGLGHIPADRQKMGLVMDSAIDDNLILQVYHCPPFTNSWGLFNLKAIADNARRLVKAFDIRTRSIKTKLLHLSGGNQQKVILAREIDRNPRALVAVQPTRGLDIGATEYIHRLLLEQRAKGAAILLISTELEEVMALSDRIVVIYEGCIIGEVRSADSDIQKIGRMMAGLKDVQPAVDHARP